jgi:hypothetical protein
MVIALGGFVHDRNNAGRFHFGKIDRLALMM